MSDDDPPGDNAAEQQQTAKPAETPRTANGSAPAVPTSKLDSLSREDLMRLIRKQTMHLKEAKKQVEELRKNQAELESKKEEVGNQMWTDNEPNDICRDRLMRRT